MIKKITKGPVKSNKVLHYACSVCGLAITMDKICDCIDACDIICCGKAMRPKR